MEAKRRARRVDPRRFVRNPLNQGAVVAAVMRKMRGQPHVKARRDVFNLIVAHERSRPTPRLGHWSEGDLNAKSGLEPVPTAGSNLLSERLYGSGPWLSQ